MSLRWLPSFGRISGCPIKKGGSRRALGNNFKQKRVLMWHKRSVLLVVMTMAVALAYLPSNAAALRSLSISATVFTASGVWTISGSGIRITCNWTLTVTASASISKTRGSRFGNTRATIGEAGCSGGRLRPLNTAEGWVTNYLSFEGTLPSGIRSVRLELVGVAWLISAFGGFGECLYRGNAQLTTGGSGLNNQITELRADERISIPLSRNLNGLFCPEEATYASTLRAERTIRITLL
jgi:hypothetical protein